MGLFDAISAPITAGITSAASIANTNATNQANLRMNAENNALQKELAQYSYEQQKEMIREQNEYNSPENQMQRYLDAGLNPNLIYGQVTPGNQSEIAKYSPPDTESSKFSPIDFLGLGNMVINVLNDIQNLEGRKLDNESKRLRNESISYKNDFERMLLGLPNNIDRESFKYQSQYYKNQRDISRYNKDILDQNLTNLRINQLKNKLEDYFKEKPYREQILKTQYEKALNYDANFERLMNYISKGSQPILNFVRTLM